MPGREPPVTAGAVTVRQSASPAEHARSAQPPASKRLSADAPPPPAAIQPRRRRRLAARRERLELAIDLHGHNQDGARRLLTREVLRAWRDGARAILIITGKGAEGEGVLRRRAPEWLGQPPLRQAVAELGPAHHRHGGDGALYVMLKRFEG